MSCQTSANKISQTFSRAAGVPAQAAKAAYNQAGLGLAATRAVTRRVSDRLQTTTTDLDRQLAPASTALLGGFNTASRWGADRLAGGVARRLGTRLAARRVGQAAVTGAARQATTALTLTGQVTALAGNAAGSLSRTSLAASVVRQEPFLLFFKRKTSTQVWNSNLAPLLNRFDRLAPGPVEKSRGQVFKVRGSTWHAGTLTVRSGQARRTLTHLQSLKYPARHLYFNRELTPKETVDVAAGTDPNRLSGYVGQVSPAESLCPAWAATKSRMCRQAALYGPPPEARPPAPPPAVRLPSVEQVERTVGALKTAAQAVDWLAASDREDD